MARWNLRPPAIVIHQTANWLRRRGPPEYPWWPRSDGLRETDPDQYSRNINLTEAGSHRVEELLGCANLYAEESLALLAWVRNALHAEVLLERDVNYIVRGGRAGLVAFLRRSRRRPLGQVWPRGFDPAVGDA